MAVLYPGNSIWTLAPCNVHCTNSACKDPYIVAGALCVNHKDHWGQPNPLKTGGFGCAKCGMKYWAEFDDIYPHLLSANVEITEEVKTQVSNLAHFVPDILNEQAAEPSIYSHIISESMPKSVVITSYGLKFGTLNKVYGNKYWDVRKTVRNPWGVKALKGLTGKDKAVQDFILRCPQSTTVIDSILYHAKKGKPIFIGCHGGKHRSVAIAEIVGNRLRDAGMNVEVVHRDLDKKEKSNALL